MGEKRELSPHIRAIPAHVVNRGAYSHNPPEAYFAPEQEHRLLQDYVRIFLNYRRLIFSVSMLIIGCTLLYSFLATPMYTAAARIKISSYSPSLSGSGIEDAVRQQTREHDYLHTQVELLTGLSIAERAMQHGNLEPTISRYFAKQTGPLEVFTPLIKAILPAEQKSTSTEPVEKNYQFSLKLLQQYLDLISVSSVRNTSLVDVRAVTSDPQLSARLANTHVEAFIDLVRSERHRSTLDSIRFLEEQAKELAAKVSQVEQNMAGYAEDNAIVSVNSDQNIVTARMAELSTMLTDATAKRIRSETALGEAEAGSGISSTSLDDRTIEELRISLKDAESEYAMLSRKFKPNYPKMIQLNSRIEGLKQNLAEQRRQALSALKAQYAGDRETEQALARELEIQKSRAFELSRKQVQYNVMKREYDSLKDLHQSVLRQLKEAQVSSESERSNISLIDRAAVPIQHSSPKRTMNMLLAVVLGPLVGFGLSLLLDSLDNTVKTREEIEQLLDLPFLGLIPAFSSSDIVESTLPLLPSANESAINDLTPVVAAGENLPALQENFVTLSAPNSIAGESFRSIRTGLLLSSADSAPKTVLITSAKKGEGKTTLSSNLAVTLAQSGARTLIIDADLRRPSVHSRFQIDAAAPGLVEVLTGQKTLMQVIVQASIDNLFIIPSGIRPPNPAELIGSATMDALLSDLTKEFDHILIDTPPVLPVTDAVVLSRIVEGVILVARGQETPKQVIKDAANRLRQVHAKVLGVVLNDVNLRSGNYYYYGDAYTDYYREESWPKRRSAA